MLSFDRNIDKGIEPPTRMSEDEAGANDASMAITALSKNDQLRMRQFGRPGKLAEAATYEIVRPFW
jgi:hypothetical protein